MRKLLILTSLLGMVRALGAYQVLFVPTLAVNVADQVRFVDPARGVAIHSVSRVERGQPFELCVAIVIREPLTAPLKLEGSVRGADAAAGATAVEMFDLPAGAKGAFFAKTRVRGRFEAADRPGEFRWELVLRDPATGERRTATAKLTLAERISDDRPMTRAEFNRFFSNYYRRPCPERLLAALKFFLGEGDAELRKKKRAGVLHILHGFALAFRLNPQFWDELAAATRGLPEHQRLYLALIFAGIGKPAVLSQKDAIDPQVAVQIAQFAGRNPLAFAEVKAPAHLDMLWMEFFVTGNFEPVRRLAAELRPRSGMTLKEAQARTAAGGKLTSGEKAAVQAHIIRSAAIWSISTNLRQDHRLLAYYLETILRRRLYPNAGTAAALAAIFRNLNQAKTQPKGK